MHLHFLRCQRYRNVKIPVASPRKNRNGTEKRSEHRKNAIFGGFQQVTINQQYK